MYLQCSTLEWAWFWFGMSTREARNATLFSHLIAMAMKHLINWIFLHLTLSIMVYRCIDIYDFRLQLLHRFECQILNWEQWDLSLHSLVVALSWAWVMQSISGPTDKRNDNRYMYVSLISRSWKIESKSCTSSPVSESVCEYVCVQLRSLLLGC